MSRLKRVTDVVASSLLLLVCAPLGVLIAILIKAGGIFNPEDRGSILRSEIRYSAGRPFRCYKFRFIKQRVLDEHVIRTVGQAKLLERNGSCTSMGRWMKKWYWDELPQLYHVCRGEMSLVGPRPFPIEDYEEDVRQGRVRKQVIRAGLTGLWQAHKGMETDRTDLEMDNDYIEVCRTQGAWRLWLYDMGILLKTVRVMAQGKGV